MEPHIAITAFHMGGYVPRYVSAFNVVTPINGTPGLQGSWLT